MTKVEYTPESAKELSKLDRQAARRIREYMGEVEKLPDPRSRGKALASNLAGLWRYRVGDYRVISSITEKETDKEPKQIIIITVLVVHVGHRKKIYK